MSYKIVFKGDLEPMYVDTAKGENLQRVLDAGTRGILKIDDIRIDASSIKAVIPGLSDPDNQSAKEHFMEKMEHDLREWGVERNRKMSQSPQKRAEDVQVARLVSYAVSGTFDVPQGLTERQQKFFGEHPDQTIASPTCYKDLLEEKLPPKSDMPTMKQVVREAAMRAADRILVADMQERNYLEDRDKVFV